MSQDFRTSTDREPTALRDDCRHAPALTGLLRSFGLDAAYHRAAGDCVGYRDRNGQDVEVLDVVAGYGALLLGHSHPELVAEAVRWLSGGSPNHTQGSVRAPAAELGRALAARTGRDDCVVFANSGAEAVEAAIKHAMLETGGRTFLAVEGGFHGKTLGAWQLTDFRGAQDPFAVAGLQVVRVPRNDVAGLEFAVEQADDPAGFLFEPILGEGGVHPLDSEFLQRAAELCADRGIPLMADECQTGLGRTGRFLESSRHDVQPDYVILSKALGGGLAKISALLISRRRYRPEFDRLHTSTFAADGFSCALALKTLELLNDGLIAGCGRKGEQLRERLEALRRKYPDVIADVRGRGLMLGIELRPQFDSPSLLLRALTARQLFGALVAGHLLKRHRVRIAPTLSAPLTLRIQPSALIPERHCDWLLDALDGTCECVRRHDIAELTAHLEARAPELRVAEVDAVLRSECFVRFHSKPPVLRNAEAPRRSLAWLFHLADADDLPSFEPCFGDRTARERADYLERVAPFAEPIVMRGVDVRSRRGDAVRVFPLLLPVTSSWMKRAVATRQRAAVRGLVQQGIRTAQELGCELVSLGQFTSIVSSNGRGLDGGGLGITTGNHYTAALVIEAVRAAHAACGFAPSEAMLAIVGAGGNIGRGCAEILGPEYERVLLIGRDAPGSRQQLEDVARGIPGAATSCDVRDVRRADAVICVTNGITPLLPPEAFRESAIVCDASIPRGVHAATGRLRPDVRLIEGGIARLPFGEDLEVPGFPLPPGEAFGCMAEGVLLALESVRDTRFTGRLSHERIRWIADVARRHGFERRPLRCDASIASKPVSCEKELLNACSR